jgi:hypothetical protein
MKWIRAFGFVLLSLALMVGSISCARNTDTTPPSSPANLAQTTPDNDNTPTFTWEAATDDESGMAGYLARVDGGEWIDIGDVITYTCENAVSDGNHTFWVKAVDKVGNEGSSASLTFIRDTTAPTITGVAASGIAEDRGTITWTTKEPSTTQVEYGVTVSYGETTAVNNDLAMTHSCALVGLDLDVTYHFRVKSQDASGNLAISDDNTFTTCDVTPPVISEYDHWKSGVGCITVSWITNEPTTGGVTLYDYQYVGMILDYYSSENSSTEHEVVMSGLGYGRSYSYSVTATDGAGLETTTELVNCYTSAPWYQELLWAVVMPNIQIGDYIHQATISLTNHTQQTIVVEEIADLISGGSIVAFFGSDQIAPGATISAGITRQIPWSVSQFEACIVKWHYVGSVETMTSPVYVKLL